MSHYRAYRIGRDDHFEAAIDLDFADDEHAIEATKELVDGFDVELWQGRRKVALIASPLE